MVYSFFHNAFRAHQARSMEQLTASLPVDVRHSLANEIEDSFLLCRNATNLSEELEQQGDASNGSSTPLPESRQQQVENKSVMDILAELEAILSASKDQLARLERAEKFVKLRVDSYQHLLQIRAQKWGLLLETKDAGRPRLSNRRSSSMTRLEEARHHEEENDEGDDEEASDGDNFEKTQEHSLDHDDSDDRKHSQTTISDGSDTLTTPTSSLPLSSVLLTTTTAANKDVSVENQKKQDRDVRSLNVVIRSHAEMIQNIQTLKRQIMVLEAKKTEIEGKSAECHEFVLKSAFLDVLENDNILATTVEDDNENLDAMVSEIELGRRLGMDANNHVTTSSTREMDGGRNAET